MLKIVPLVFSPEEVEAAVSTPAECHPLPVCLLGSLWSRLVHKRGGALEKYVFCRAQDCQDLLTVKRLSWVFGAVLFLLTAPGCVHPGAALG